ncbi:hypothetical protein [Ileibacterium valens]|uniref:hypothetical protein n=1 Tax=Ileibacterium valens TaxID=1862668 RepID=UPI00272FE4C2|nr:hypothetical protein [Ileibacterium valens]
MLIKYLITQDRKLVQKLDAEGMDYFVGSDNTFYFPYYEPVYAEFDLENYEFSITEQVCF